MEVKIHYNNLEELTLKGVYLIRNKDNNLLKIGYSNNLKRRFEDIIKGFNFVGHNPILTIECFIECEDCYNLEIYLHEKFKSNRVQNEWFNIDNISEIIEVSKTFKRKEKQNIEKVKKVKKKNKSVVKHYKVKYLFRNEIYNIIFKSSKAYPDFNYLNSICYSLGYNPNYYLLYDGFLEQNEEGDLLIEEIKSMEDIELYNILNSEYIIQLKDSAWIPIIEFLSPIVKDIKKKEVEHIKEVLNISINYINSIDLEDNNSIKDNYDKMYKILEEELYCCGTRKHG